MICRGACSLYKPSFSVDKFRYLNGQKRCSKCEIFLNWNDLYCPCCRHKLRTRPKTLKAVDRDRRHNLRKGDRHWKLARG